MPTHLLPDERLPVLLSAHDPDLIRQDAAAILDYLDRIAATKDSADVTGAVASTLLRLRRVRRHRAVCGQQTGSNSPRGCPRLLAAKSIR